MTITWKSDGMYGDSSDTKPTNVPTWTRFVETNTGEIFIWNGTNWKNISNLVRDSLYEGISLLSTVAKQRVVEWFTGYQLGSMWITTNGAGTNSFRMSDNKDEGYEIVTGSTNGNNGIIYFNNKHHYFHNSSKLVALVRRVTATNARLYVGLLRSYSTNTDYAMMDNQASKSFIDLESRAASGASSWSSSDVAPHSNWTLVKLEFGSSDVKMYLDGVLKVTKTTDRPTNTLQPIFFSITNTSAAATCRIKYLEAYNV